MEAGTSSCRRFSLDEILSATRNFDDALVIGKGGFGKVYKATIKVENGESCIVALKRLDPLSSQGAPEFRAEIEMLTKLRHCNLVSLIGYCNDNSEMILVYEFMPHGTLDDHLHKYGGTSLSWVQRLKISIGAARGLHYLHTGTGTQHGVIHRDVKTSNILLDKDYAAKISDFGLSKIGPTNTSAAYVSTFVRGTFGYLDPEYFLTGRLTRQSDVFAFGVVLFELLCGRVALDNSLDEDRCSLVKWAHESINKGKVSDIIDVNIKSQILPKCLKGFVQIADRCLTSESKKRPTMAQILAALELSLTIQNKFNSHAKPPAAGVFTFARMFRRPFISAELKSAQSDKKSSTINEDANEQSSRKDRLNHFPDYVAVKERDLAGHSGGGAENLEPESGRYSPLMNRNDLSLGTNAHVTSDQGSSSSYHTSKNEQVTFNDPVSIPVSSNDDDFAEEGNRDEGNEGELFAGSKSTKLSYTTITEDPNSHSPFISPVLEELGSSFSESPYISQVHDEPSSSFSEDHVAARGSWDVAAGHSGGGAENFEPESGRYSPLMNRNDQGSSYLTSKNEENTNNEVTYNDAVISPVSSNDDDFDDEGSCHEENEMELFANLKSKTPSYTTTIDDPDSYSPVLEEPGSLFSEGSSNRNSNATLPLKELIAQEMSKVEESVGGSPNLIAKLMGLDTLPLVSRSTRVNSHFKPDLQLHEVGDRAYRKTIFGEIERRLNAPEFKERGSGKDLRALKQILEAMQKKGLMN